MRLTLRTLIAWLDDTLNSEEVRTIGKQVAESPYAKELVDRVQRVTRQRRLTVPGDSGVEATDANLVAAYLDNELPADQVAEFEKKCLTSDVHLAEVASVHQILSLIGQKAKVPADAKLRMYRLVRGRETTKEAPAESSSQEGSPRKIRTPAASPPPPPAPITEPIGAWSAIRSTRRPLVERFGAAALVLLLIVALGWTAVHSLRPDPSAENLVVNRPLPPPPAPKIPEPLPAHPIPAPRSNPEATVPAPPENTPKPDDTKGEDAGSGEPGAFDAIQGVVLRPGAEGGWERVEPKVPLKARSRLLNLAPFRNTLKLGRMDVDLIDSTEVVVGDHERGQPARLELKRGQIVWHASPSPTPFAVLFESQVLTITAPGGVMVGIERMPTLLPGQSEPAPARLRIFVPDGRVVLRAGEIEEIVNGPADISFNTNGRFTEKGRQALPSWVTESAPSGFSKEVGDQFNTLLRPGRAILADLVEAMDEPQKDVKRMAVHALGSIGAMEQVVEVVNRKEDPTVHRAGVEVLRSGLAQGGEAAKAVREGLIHQYDRPWSDIAEKLLVGYRPEEAKDEATLAKLVDYLASAPVRGIRELALDNLRSLTGRDSLEYDPETPEGKGLKAWQDLVRKKEVGKEARPAAKTQR